MPSTISIEKTLSFEWLEESLNSDKQNICRCSHVLSEFREVDGFVQGGWICTGRAYECHAQSETDQNHLQTQTTIGTWPTE